MLFCVYPYVFCTSKSIFIYHLKPTLDFTFLSGLYCLKSFFFSRQHGDWTGKDLSVKFSSDELIQSWTRKASTGLMGTLLGFPLG